MPRGVVPGNSQGGHGALRDHLGLVLCHGGEDVNREPVGLREVHRLELDAAFHKVRDEGHVAGKPVQLGDEERGARPSAPLDGSLKLRPVGSLPTLNFDVRRLKQGVYRPEVGLDDGR